MLRIILCIATGIFMGACSPPSSGSDAGPAGGSDAGVDAGGMDAGNGMDADSDGGTKTDAGGGASGIDGGGSDSGIDAGGLDGGMDDGGVPDGGASAICNPTAPVSADIYGIDCPNAAICDLTDDCVAPQYTVNGDGTVTDNVTSLVWQQTLSSGQYTWSDATPPASGSAQAYCQGLSLSGEGWRLPTLQELFSLVDIGNAPPMIDSTVLPNTPFTDFFWTASPSVDTSGLAWAVQFYDGLTSTAEVGYSGFVRCVR